MRTTGSFWFPHTDLYFYGGAGASDTISADNYGQALITYMPYTTTIDKIAFYVAATTLAGTLTGQIETVTPSTNLPTGTLYHANATGTRSMLTTDDAAWFEISFTAPVAVTGGDLVAFTLARLAGSTFTGTLRRVVTNGSSLPIHAGRAGAAWSLTAGRSPAIVVHSTTDGWITIPGAPIYIDSASQNYSPITTPDEIGVKLTMPFTARLTALGVYLGGLTAADAFTVRLYDASNSVLWSKAMVVGTDLTTTAGTKIFPLPARPTFKKGTTYRVAVEATTGTLTMSYISLPDATYTNSTGLNGAALWTERTDGGSWTDTANRWPLINFQFDQIATNVPAHGMMR